MKQEVYIVHMSKKEDGEHSKTIYQTSKGIYNTKDKSLYGNTTQEITSEVDNKNYKEEVNYSTNISYENGQVQSTWIQVWMFHT